MEFPLQGARVWCRRCRPEAQCTAESKPLATCSFVFHVSKSFVISLFNGSLVSLCA